MKFSRNPATGFIEVYTDEGTYVGIMSTSNAQTDMTANDGGPGSGNFGHAGRPGHVGGSAKGSGGGSFRSGSKETGYTSFTQHKLFKGIASTARAAKDRNEFIDKMSRAQKDALTNQYFACGADQGKGHRFLGEYADRIYDMLHNRKGTDIRQKSKPVDGKDLSDTWNWDETKNKPSWQTMGTAEIDTEIEAIIHEQGFDGVPKVVSKAEFDRITKDHPEMPVLYRTYAAPTPETLDQYDKDLESGFFYVDASTGGSGFGQGMYCAGVYKEGANTRNISDMTQEEVVKKIGFVKTDDGRFFRRTGSASKKENVHDLVRYNSDVGDYCCFFFDGKRTDMYKVEERPEGGIQFVSESGEVMSPLEAETADAAASYKIVDVERRNEILTQGAIEEMKHYRALNLRRIEANPPYIAPEGMVMVVGGANDNPDRKYFDPNKATSFADKKPEEGQLIGMLSPKGEAYNDGLFVYRDGKITYNAGNWDPWEPEPNEKWAPIEGDCEAVEIDPQYSTRMMTLDPSAKIVTYEEIRELRTKLVDKRQEERSRNLAEQKAKFVHDFTEELLENSKVPEDKKEKYRELFDLWAFGTTNEEGERADMLAIELGEHTYNGKPRTAHLLEIFGRALDNFKPVRPEYRPIPPDDGVFAAMLGYDAINAVGHGQSKSYTVVLNRSKIIMSEDRVDLFEG